MADQADPKTIRTLAKELEKAKSERAGQETDRLKKELLELKAWLSQLRKKGLDTSIAEIWLISIPSRIQMAQVTMDAKDFAKAGEYITKVKDEIAEIERAPPDPALAIASEIMHVQEHTARIVALIAKCKARADEGKKGEANELYNELQQVYNSLPQEVKIQFTEECMSLYKRISS